AACRHRCGVPGADGGLGGASRRRSLELADRESQSRFSRFNLCRAVDLRNGFKSLSPVWRVAPSVRGGKMKGKHPETMVTSVRCSTCGNEFTMRSTRLELVVEICSNCHPVYTGVERAVATGSRIERFERRRARATALA